MIEPRRPRHLLQVVVKFIQRSTPIRLSRWVGFIALWSSGLAYYWLGTQGLILTAVLYFSGIGFLLMVVIHQPRDESEPSDQNRIDIAEDIFDETVQEGRLFNPASSDLFDHEAWQAFLSEQEQPPATVGAEHSE